MITFSNRSMPALRQVYRNRKNSMRVRRLAWLEYVARFYNSSNRSSVGVGSGCKYYPAHANTPGCAIGADIPKKLAKRCDARPNSSGIYDIFNDFKDRFKPDFPEWMKDFPVDFLARLQNFHDNRNNWNAEGLSKDGEEKYNTILSTINIG